MLLDKTVIVSKINTDGPGTNKEAYITHSGFLEHGLPSASLRINIQPASPELTALADGEIFKTFKAFTNASGLIEGMRVTVSGTAETYTVKGRERYDYGVGQHYEIILIRGGR